MRTPLLTLPVHERRLRSPPRSDPARPLHYLFCSMMHDAPSNTLILFGQESIPSTNNASSTLDVIGADCRQWQRGGLSHHPTPSLSDKGHLFGRAARRTRSRSWVSKDEWTHVAFSFRYRPVPQLRQSTDRNASEFYRGLPGRFTPRLMEQRSILDLVPAFHSSR